MFIHFISFVIHLNGMLIWRWTIDIVCKYLIMNSIYLYDSCVTYPEGALDYFEYSRKLELTANTKDTFNSRCLNILRLLDGDRDKIGLIQEAKNLKKQKEQKREE